MSVDVNSKMEFICAVLHWCKYLGLQNSLSSTYVLSEKPVYWAFAHDCSRLYIYSHVCMIILLLNLWQKILCSSTVPIKWDFIGANCLSCYDVESMLCPDIAALKSIIHFQQCPQWSVCEDAAVHVCNFITFASSHHLLELSNCLLKFMID
jgi:hypothetical protein